MRINGQAAMNPGCSIASNGIITGKISPQTQIITDSSNCIFRFGTDRNREVAPVQLADDQNKFDREKKVFTFTRTTVASKKGRAEMNFCFTKPTSALISGFNQYQLAYLSHTRQIGQYCDNAVHDTSRNTQSKYGFYILIPSDNGTTNAQSLIAQWHGRPRRLVYKDASGSIKELADPLPSITNNASLKTSKAAYDAVKRAGGKFNYGGYAPLSVSIVDNNLAVETRYDNRRYNEKKIRCGLNKATYPVGTTKKCLNTATEKMYATVIYREPLTDWIDRWNHLKLHVNWRPLGSNSTVRVFKNFEIVKEWSGLLGRNDKYGPYMKYGLYASSRSKNFRIMVGHAYSDIND